MSGLAHEHGRLEPHSLLSPGPMEADECVGDVVGVTQAVDEPCCRVHHRMLLFPLRLCYLAMNDIAVLGRLCAKFG